jgi:hypothetical protein
MTSDGRRLQELSIFVHGVLAGLHALGIIYNVKRRHPFQVAAHTSAVAFDLWAAGEHIKHIRENANESDS